MGQSHSDAAGPNNTGDTPTTQEITVPSLSNSSSRSHPASMEAMIAEAMTSTRDDDDGDDDNESLEAKAQRALECPCVADLRQGPCGTQFTESFLCFMKSTAQEKGSDCVNPFIALQKCIKDNPEAFSKDVLGEENTDEDAHEEVKDLKIIPPSWAKEPRTKK